MDLQLLTGLLLYGLFSPMTRAAFLDFAGAMGDAVVRYWAVEHASLMLVAVVLVHMARILVRRNRSDRSRHIVTVVLVGAALVAVAVGMPWPFIASVGRPLLPM